MASTDDILAAKRQPLRTPRAGATVRNARAIPASGSDGASGRRQASSAWHGPCRWSVVLAAGVAAAGWSGALASTPAPAQPTRVEAARIEYLHAERRTVLTGDPLVTLRRGDATLTCRRMVAEGDASGALIRATCEGDVRLSRGAQVATCARAAYDAAAGTIVCRGAPVLRDGASVLACDEVLYDLTRDRVVATGGKGVLVAPPPARPAAARAEASP